MPRRSTACTLAAGRRRALGPGCRPIARSTRRPADDAFTWQFALDRLLLGHASGSDGDIAGVAPWPELEGSALDALDRLLRLLRVLARYQKPAGRGDVARHSGATAPAGAARCPAAGAAAGRRQPARAGAPAQTDQRVRPRAPTTPASRATCRRRCCARISSRRLAEADTRAPLLTGGVSFGADGADAPAAVPGDLRARHERRRFPAPRPGRPGSTSSPPNWAPTSARHGDRSLREDDRFLFLQLFASAQDVFYLSYLGADPRDGSVREPSVLVSELIDAAASNT